MRRLLLAWRIARHLQANEGALLNEMLRAQINGRPLTWAHGSPLQRLFTLLVRGRERV